jgi:hypothetical protein
LFNFVLQKEYRGPCLCSALRQKDPDIDGYSPDILVCGVRPFGGPSHCHAAGTRRSIAAAAAVDSRRSATKDGDCDRSALKRC